MNKSIHILILFFISIHFLYCQNIGDQIDVKTDNHCTLAANNIWNIYNEAGNNKAINTPTKDEFIEEYIAMCEGRYSVIFPKWSQEETNCIIKAEKVVDLTDCNPNIFSILDEATIVLSNNTPEESSSIDENTIFVFNVNYRIHEYNINRDYKLSTWIVYEFPDAISVYVPIVSKVITDQMGQILVEFSIEKSYFEDAPNKPYELCIALNEMESTEIYKIISNKIFIIFN